ncbi:MAG: HD domain-containing protein [Endomicrobium sp.]|jgi:metal-dependent HD superfamily phosphatase/phosphodiesterase|nr:HD domain-containing protein [Endomicrobium sp.]
MDEILTFETIKNNPEIQVYLEFTDKAFALTDYKDHGRGHALHAANIAEQILKCLGYSKREQELAKIAAFVHDIGNVVSKHGHDQSSAKIFLNVIGEDKYNEEIFVIASAVGCHEDKTMNPVSPIAAALVLADKTDVRHDRIRAKNFYYLDKHFRVVTACQKVDIVANKKRMNIELRIKIDTSVCSVMDYFEIFMSRTNYCRRASSVLNCNFELYINEDKFL